jgi:xylan 1,4-beta-xylosidase
VGEPAGAVPKAPACQTNPLCSHPVCDTTKSIKQRVASLVKSLTLQEKIYNLIDASAGSERIGLPAYAWWNEATHGIGGAPGGLFRDRPGNFSYATSFPSPITTAAGFNAKLFAAIGKVVGREGRAYANFGYTGRDFWAPNMNPFRDPRWGRGQETPGEDIHVVNEYIKGFVPGLQGPNLEDKQVIATCKHYAVYDLETARHANNYNPTQQDMSDYFLASFKTCVRDTHVGSVMCSYNA